MAISKLDMAARAAKAAKSAPSLEDRLAHARELADSHPGADQPAAASPVPRALPPLERSGAFTDLAPLQGTHEFTSVPLDLIDPNPFNARRIYRPERVTELAASLAAHGQDVPGLATFRNGRYLLIAGHYRLRALKLNNARAMKIVLKESLTDRELYQMSYRENAEREGQSHLDNAMAWRELLNAGTYANETEIAEATGQTQPNVNKTLAVLRLSKDTLEVVQEAPTAFGLSVLYELALFEDAAGKDKTTALARQVLVGDAGRKEIQEARALIQAPRHRKAKETSRQYKLHAGGALVGSLKEWDSGKVSFEVQINDAREKAALVTELKARFGITD